MDQVYKELLEAASKPNKQARTKKRDVAVGAYEIDNETIVTRESLQPKRKSTSGGGEREVS